MNPKLYPSAAAMLAASPHMHQLAVTEFGPSVDARLEASMRMWHDAWTLLRAVRMLRFRRAVDFRVFLRGVRVRLTRTRTLIGFNSKEDAFRCYVATSRPYHFKHYAIVFRLADGQGAVEVEYAW